MKIEVMCVASHRERKVNGGAEGVPCGPGRPVKVGRLGVVGTGAGVLVALGRLHGAQGSQEAGVRAYARGAAGNRVGVCVVKHIA